MDDRRDAVVLTLPSDIEEEFLSVGVHLRALTSGGALGDRLGISVSEASVERVVGTLPVDGNTQPRGLLHGGASAVLAETLGSIGAMMHARTSRMPVGVELNCTHHRGARKGQITGVAVPLHLGRTMTTHEIVITDDEGRRICTARLTCLLKDLAQRS
jgi:1,4-dihydroxy-2-naphthoyl-CoA hydrolase